MSASTTIDASRAEHLAALTTAAHDARETYERHRDRWHQAIADAVDDGLTLAQVGRIVGLTPQRINAIVVRVYSRNAS